ncbi:MAG: hypothetical protein AAGK14_15625 [Verrucomicrobiota bacterium]
MSAPLTVTPCGGDLYEVEVRAATTTSHAVTVTDAARDELAPGADKEALLRASFEFLLEREPNTAILSRFDLPLISRYFPDYPEVIRRRLG